jgi:hypothetical protein
MIPAVEKIRRDLEYRVPGPLAHIVLERELAVALIEWVDKFPLEAR